MKRILLVSDAWHPQVNGVVRVAEALLPYLSEAGYEVKVLHPGEFVTLPLPFYPEIRLALPWGIQKTLADYKPHAVHLMTEGPLGVAMRRACLKAGVPFTSWYHTHFQFYIDLRIPGLLPLVGWFMRRFHRKAARTFVSTDGLKNVLESQGYKNLTVVPLGVDVERFVRRHSSLPPLPKPVFVYFSRLAPEKNPEAFLKLSLPGTKLVLGDGPQRKKLEKKYGAANTFVGYKTGEELVEWLSLCDVFVFPSRTETFGLVALEALACGIPVAAYDVMGPRDIITAGKDGYLSDDLADAAKKCLALNPEDCRQKALQYSWQRAADAFVKNLAWIT